MAIADTDIIDVNPKKLGRSESVFIPAVIKGMGTTLRHMLSNVTRPGKNKKNIWVLQYPEERREHRDVLEGGLERETFLAKSYFSRATSVSRPGAHSRSAATRPATCHGAAEGPPTTPCTFWRSRRPNTSTVF